MATTRRMQIGLGLFALATLGMLAFLTLMFGTFLDAVLQPFHYTVRFPQAPGVERGTVVRKSGIRIGEVQSLDLNPDTGEVELKINVQRQYQLRVGDQAVLGRGLLLGDTAIDFLPERPDRTPAPDGHVFIGRLPQDIGQAIGTAIGKTGDLIPVTQDALLEIRNAARKFNEIAPELRKTNAEAQVTLLNVGRAAETADNLLRANQDRIALAIERGTDMVTRLAQLFNEENQRNLNVTIRNARAASDNVAAMLSPENREQINAALKNLRAASDSLAGFLTQENQQNAAALLKNARTATENVNLVFNDENRANTAAALKSLRQAADNAASLLGDDTKKNVNETLNNTKRASDNLAAMLSDDNRKTVEATLKNVKTASDNLETTMRNADLLVTSARQTLQATTERLESVGKSAEEAMRDLRGIIRRSYDTMANIDQTMVDVRGVTKPLAERAPRILKSIDEGAANFNLLVLQMSDVIRAVSEADGTLHRLVFTPALYNNLNDAACQLNKGMQRLDRILQDVALFADKIARHPEVLGVGGAVAPSTGVKR